MNTQEINYIDNVLPHDLADMAGDMNKGGAGEVITCGFKEPINLESERDGFLQPDPHFAMNIQRIQCTDGEIIDLPQDFAEGSSRLVNMAEDMKKAGAGDYIGRQVINISVPSAVLLKAMNTSIDRRTWSDDEVLRLASVGDYLDHKPLLEAAVQELGRRKLAHENPNLVALTGQSRADFIDVKGEVRSNCGGYWSHWSRSAVSLEQGKACANVHQQPNQGGKPTNREGNKANVSIESLAVSPGHWRVKLDFAVSRKVQGGSIMSLHISGKVPAIDAQSKIHVSAHVNALSEGKGTRTVIASHDGHELLRNTRSSTSPCKETLVEDAEILSSGTDLSLDVTVETRAGGGAWPPTHDHLAPQCVHGSLTVDVRLLPRLYPIFGTTSSNQSSAASQQSCLGGS